MPGDDAPVAPGGGAARPARRAGLPARIAWGLAFVVLFALSFPFRAGEAQLDVAWVAGWLALLPLARGIAGLRPRGAFAWATGFGVLAHVPVVFWLYVVVHVHGHAPAWVAVGAVLGMSLYISLHLGVAAATVVWLRPAAGRAAFLLLPAAWVVAEHLRTFEPGFPWTFLGYAAHDDGPLLGLARVGGVYGLSFVMATFAVLLAERRWRPALICLAAAHALGAALAMTALYPADAAGASEARWAGLVQANIPQDEKWDPDRAGDAFEAHLETSRLAALAGEVDIVIWPESSVPVFLEAQPEYREAVAALARDVGAPIVVGGIGLEPDGERRYRYFNSVFLVDSDGSLAARYDKSLLVPFGEYVPWRTFLGFLAGLATGIASGDLTPGPGPRTFDVAALGPQHALSPLICYEVIYPALVREAVRGGASLLLNVTNDAWYGRTSAPHQFLTIAMLRSAETGRPMLRAANTGVSAVIDAAGMVRARTPIFEQHALRVRIPPTPTGDTLYTRLGDWVVWASWGILIVIGGIRFGSRSRSGDAGSTGATAGAGGTDRGAAEAPLTSTASERDSRR